MATVGKLCRILVLVKLLGRNLCSGIVINATPTPSGYLTAAHYTTYSDADIPGNENHTADWLRRPGDTGVVPDCENSVKGEFINVTFLNILIPSCGDTVCSDSDRAACQCDRECIIFGDCCYSVIANMSEQGSNVTVFHESVAHVRRESLIGNFTFGCLQGVKSRNSYFMIDKCPDFINDTSDVQVYCSSNPTYDYTDIPVDYVLSDNYIATFRNAYCAECNGIFTDELRPWSAHILCKESNDNITIHPDMTLDEIGVIEDCIIITKSLFRPRRCKAESLKFKACPSDVAAESIVTASATFCPLYIYPLNVVPIEKQNHSIPTYRNIHCYVCNHETIETDSFVCNVHPNLKPGAELGEDYKLIDLQVMFDIGNNEATVSKVKCGMTSVCDENEVYDCISKTCRGLFCPLGQSLRSGNCVEDSNPDLGRETTIPIDNSPLTRDGNVLILEVTFSSDGKSEDEMNNRNATTETLLRKLESDIATDIDISFINVSYNEAIFGYKRLQEPFKLADSVFKVVRKTTSGFHIDFNIFVITLRNFYDRKYLKCSTDAVLLSKSDITLEERNKSEIFNVLASGISVPVENSKWSLSYEHIDDNTMYLPVKMHTCLPDDKMPNMNCTMVVFPFDDVKIEDSFVHILEIGVKLPDTDFVVHSNNVYVCSDIVTQYEGIMDIFENRLTYRILSIVTSSLSIAGVLVVIVAHGVTKRLRNAHGLNLTALSVSILVIHVLLIAQVPTLSNVFCHAYAIALHVAFLVMFTWMNIIGVDMARIFLADHIVSRSNPTKRFVVYIIMSILIPVVLVGLCASLDATDVSFRPDYAKNGICWLTNGKGIMAFVLMPVVVAMVLNICCFTITVVSIQRKTRQTKVVRNGANRTYVIVFLKMTIILGFTWIFGIVGAVWQQTWLSIFNIILNGLQGLSILICSFVNARNVRRFRETIKASYTSNESNENELSIATDVTNSAAVSKDAT